MLHVSVESVFVQEASLVLDPGKAQDTTNISLPGPSMTLQGTASEISFYEKIVEKIATASPKGQSDIYEDQKDEEHGFDTDIRKLVWTEIAARGGPTPAEI